MQQIVSTESLESRINILKNVSIIEAGVVLDNASLVDGVVVMEAQPISAPVSGVRYICKQALMVSTTSTATSAVCSTGQHHFKVGDIAMYKTGQAAHKITSITANATTGVDAIVVATSIGTVGTWLYQASTVATATAGGALKYSADAIIKSAFTADALDTVGNFKAATMRADIVEDCIATEYLSTLKGVFEQKR